MSYSFWGAKGCESEAFRLLICRWQTPLQPVECGRRASGACVAGSRARPQDCYHTALKSERVRGAPRRSTCRGWSRR